MYKHIYDNVIAVVDVCRNSLKNQNDEEEDDAWMIEIETSAQRMKECRKGWKDARGTALKYRE